MNAGWVDGRWMTWGKLPPISICGEMKPFSNVLPLNKKNENAVAWAFTSKEALYALYISSGRYVPAEAKAATGFIAHYCDEQGRVQIYEKATHIGWDVTND